MGPIIWNEKSLSGGRITSTLSGRRSRPLQQRVGHHSTGKWLDQRGRAAEVEEFLTMLATERKVSASTHNQALSALLFLYREVLRITLPWLENLNRPAQKRRIPSVLTKEEVAALLGFVEGPTALLAHLLYGTGMRLMEGLRLRVKDVDFDRHVIVVREAKGNKDRVVMLPRSLASALRAQVLAARTQWDADRKAQRGGVETPHALEMKYPQVGRSWGWFWVFPSPTLTVRPHSAPQFRHPFVAGRHRHSHGSRTVGSQRCFHHHDLHPCA
jgi:integrase